MKGRGLNACFAAGYDENGGVAFDLARGHSVGR